MVNNSDSEDDGPPTIIKLNKQPRIDNSEAMGYNPFKELKRAEQAVEKVTNENDSTGPGDDEQEDLEGID